MTILDPEGLSPKRTGWPLRLSMTHVKFQDNRTKSLWVIPESWFFPRWPSWITRQQKLFFVQYPLKQPEAKNKGISISRISHIFPISHHWPGRANALSRKAQNTQLRAIQMNTRYMHFVPLGVVNWFRPKIRNVGPVLEMSQGEKTAKTALKRPKKVG